MTTKHDIIEKIYESKNGSWTRNEVKDIVSSVFDQIIHELTNGGDVKISRFGTFKAAGRRPKAARNPRTGEAVMIAERTVAKFKQARFLQEVLNGETPTGDDEEE